MLVPPNCSKWLDTCHVHVYPVSWDGIMELGTYILTTATQVPLNEGYVKDFLHSLYSTTFQLKPQLSHVKSMLDSAVYSHLNCLRFFQFIWKAYITFSTNICVFCSPLGLIKEKYYRILIPHPWILNTILYIFILFNVWLKIDNLLKWKVQWDWCSLTKYN